MLRSKRELLIAAAVIDYFHSDKRSEVLSAATEFQFLHYKRRADVIILNKGGIIACEIKSKDDNLSSLPGQLFDYNSVFPSTYVATESKHARKIIELADESIGILLYDDERKRLKIIRRAKKNPKNYKALLETSIPNSIFPKAPPNNQKEIREACISYFKHQTESQFKDFLKFRGVHTHTEDLKSLKFGAKNSLT